MKKYTVFFSADVRKVIATDGHETYGSVCHRAFRAANELPASLIEVMLVKPDLENEERFPMHPSFRTLWKQMVPHWDRVRAAFDQASRGTAYIDLTGADPRSAYVSVRLTFGELRVNVVITESSRLMAWTIRLGSEVLADARPQFTHFDTWLDRV